MTTSMFSPLRLSRHFCSRELSGEKIVSFPAEINEAKKALGNLGVGDGRGGAVRVCQVGIPSLRHLLCGQEWSLKHYELLGKGLGMKVILKD